VVVVVVVVVMMVVMMMMMMMLMMMERKRKRSYERLFPLYKHCFLATNSAATTPPTSRYLHSSHLVLAFFFHPFQLE
jgi:flagellar basal body-associated protein FliL